jgi:energy-coupling factor transporter ATP-binding protein EcfA2
LRAPVADIHALKAVTVEIHQGERVGLLGRNGAGKTSLLRLIAGIYPASSGHVEALQALVSTEKTSAGDAEPEPMRPHRKVVYLGDHRALVRTAWGHKMFVDTRDLGLAPHLLLDGSWELWVTAAFLTNLREGMTVVDVGANIGYYSLLAASNVGSGGRLVSFEPHLRLPPLRCAIRATRGSGPSLP